MNKKIIPIFLTIAIVAGIVFSLKPIFEDQWSRFMDFTHPNYFMILKKEWANKPTDFLIDKLNHPSIKYSGVATSLLRERVDEARIDRLVQIINQTRNTRGRGLALSVLFYWDANKATNISMEILKTGANHSLFQSAMGMLAHRKYDPSFPYLVKLAQQPDGYKNGSVNMLKDFGRPEAIPVLEEMLKKINNKDPVVQGILRDTILEAIQVLKSKR